MKNIENLLKDLTDVSANLEAFSRKYSDLYLEYSGDIFPQQSYLSENLLDNLILQSTHEMASNISFYLIQYGNSPILLILGESFICFPRVSYKKS